ncbi:MAG: alpha/beta hydrolase [Bacteroidota bacterium]
MKCIYFLMILTLIMPTSACAQSEEVIAHPIVLDREELNLHGQECLILVPENRHKANSRRIAVHYFRFPAKKASGKAPIFYLPGGPGDSYSLRDFYGYFSGKRARIFAQEISFLNQQHDIILLNQRGNAEAPGFNGTQFKYWVPNGKPDQLYDLPVLFQEEQNKLMEKVAALQQQGVDVSGYDILNLVDDIESLRQYYQYGKISLVGSSFGSQWALSYLRQYPEQVERAFLSGLEPIDYSRDDPAEVWKVYQELARLAEADSNIRRDLPAVGLIEALKTIIRRLEKRPQVVQLPAQDGGAEIRIPIGADAVRLHVTNPFARNRQESLSTWPKYIHELYEGNYELLATYLAENRRGYELDILLNPLVDNSLGISEVRRNKLANQPEKRWIADGSDFWEALRNAAPTRDVGDAFRQQQKSEVPILMLHGNLDRSTPLENALSLQAYFPYHHLLQVKGGTHAAKWQLAFANPDLMRKLWSFLDGEGKDMPKDLPTTFSLPAIEFLPIQGPTLLERLQQD